MSEEAAKGFTMDEVRSRMSEGTTEAVGSSGPAQGQAMGFTMDEVRAKANQAPQNNASLGDYLRAIPATAADIGIGAVEGVASAIGEFTGDYDLARSISETRTDVNDAIMGDAPESVKSDFAYKVASGLGSTIPYLLAAVATKRPSLVTKIGANGFFLASAGQQVRDDYLGTMGVTSETATDEQMSESNKVGAMGAIPIAMAERLGAGVILGAFKSGAIPAGKVMQRIGQYASAGAGEAATEVAQSGIINSIASYVAKYDEDRPITRGMAESALIGFLVGGGVNAGVDTVERAITQGDRLKAGVQDGSINSKDVIDKDVGSKFAAIAMESGSIPEADSIQASTITDPKGMSNFISKTLTPLSQRLGRAGKEVVREFRKYEMNTGLKLKEFKDATAPFSRKMLELKKKSPEDYKILSQALANANELSVSLPDSVQKDLEKKAQLQPEITRSTSEQLLDTTNANAQVINEQIGQARKALEGSGLKTRIQIVESGNSYYDPSTNTIAISAAEADTTTVAHEYFHAALGQAVKTDVELQSMTRNMFDSVIRATVSGSSINEQLQGFVSQYDSNVQNEEFLAQTVGELASQYETLDITTRTRVKVWINQVMQKLGVSGVFKEATTDAEVIEQLNAFARFSGKPEALTGRVGAVIQNENNGGSIISEPVRATKFVLKDLTMAPKVSFGKKPRKNSNINSGDSLDIVSLLNDAVANDKKVVFWQSDQLGIGTYTSKVNGKKYELDAGLGFAKSKVKGRDKFAWATGSEGVANQVAKADLVFMVSGDPETQHFFNENIFDIIYDNVEASQGSVDNFVENLSRSENTADITLADALRKIQDKFGSKKELKKSPARKEFNLALSKRMLAKKGQGKTDDKLWSEMNKIFPFADEVRDGHLADNGFGVRDIYAVFAPNGKTGVDEKMHSTYSVGVGGKFLGTPDRVVNAIDVLSSDYMAELYENPKNQTSRGPISEGQLGAKVVGAQATYARYNGKNLKETTPQQVADAARAIREQKSRTASDEEMARGLSNDGMSILEKYGMTEDYRGVRGVLDSIKGEYTDLGLDKNFIENYFPRSVQDLDGLKASYGQKTGIVDQEIRRYEKMTGQSLSDTERQMMYEKLARSKLYRSGINAPNNMQERITDFIQEPQMQYYADPEVALDSYIDKMVNSIETKKLIGDSASGKTQGAEPVAGRLGEVMDKMASEGRLRDDQIDVIRGAVSARFGQHGAQYGFVKGAKNMGYLATMGNVGSTITQLGDFMFSMVQNGLIPTVEATLGKKNITIEDLGIAKDMVEIDSKQGAGMFSKSVNNVFKWTGLTAMDRLAKNTNINAAHKVLTKGAKAGQNTNSYKKTLARLKKIQGNDAYATIADLQSGKKSDLVIEALYNNLADVAPISLTEMPEAYAGNPNLRIMYSLKSYTIKQFNFVRERVFTKIYVGLAQKNPQMIGEGMSDMMKILAFSTLANGSSDILKAIVFNREIDENEMFWNTFLRLFGVTKYTTVQIRKEGLGDAMLKTIAPPQFGMMSDVFKDVSEMSRLQEMKSTKFVPFVGKLYYWREGRGEDVEKRLSRLK